MSILLDLLAEVFRGPTLASVARELATLAAPLWFAAVIGLLIGWAWRPRWAVLQDLLLVLAAPAPLPPPQATPATDKLAFVPRATNDVAASAAPAEDTELAVNTADLKHLCRVVEEKDDGPASGYT